MPDLSKDLTVIIPVYNEEKNINNILKDLTMQTINGFEVIIVDDGSSDRTLQIIKCFNTDKFNLKVLEQKNSGAAAAREFGVMSAEGNFVAFIDCDDKIHSHCLEYAYENLASEKKRMISLFELIYCDAHGEEKGRFKNYTEKCVIDGFEGFNNCITSWGLHGFGIYCKELLLEAYAIYKEINPGQVNYLNNDEVISRISFSLAEKIYLSKGKYYFVANNNSTVRRVNKNYYKVIENSFYMSDYVSLVQKNKNFNFNDAAIVILISSTLWGVFVRYCKWYLKFNSNERHEWRTSIQAGIIRIKKIIKSKNVEVDLNSKIKLFLINMIL